MRAFCSMLSIALLLSFAFGSASTAQAGGETAWKVSALGGGQQMASIRTSGPSEPKRGMALTCQGKAPMLVIPTKRIGTKPRGNLAMTGTTGGIPVAVSMIWDPQGSAWVASMSDRAALDLLAGASTSVSLTLDGTALGTIPLTGSSNAIRTALAGCYVPVVAPVVAMGGAGGYASRSLPFRQGVYVDPNGQFNSLAIGENPQTCTRYNQTITFDGQRFVHRFYSGDFRGAIWTRTIRRFNNLSGNRFRVFEKFDDSSEKYERPTSEEDNYGTDMWQVGDDLFWRAADPHFVPPTIKLRFCPNITSLAAASHPVEQVDQVVTRNVGSVAMLPGMSDEEAVRVDIAKIYGFRDGKPIRGEADYGENHLSPRLQSLLDACLAAVEGAGHRPDGSGSYDIVGDQGCEGDAFGFDQRGDDDNTDYSKIRITLRRLPDDAIDAAITPGARRLRYRKFTDRWMIDDVFNSYDGGPYIFSDTVKAATAEILKLPRLRRKAQ
jgi:hypothetical protein